MGRMTRARSSFNLRVSIVDGGSASGNIAVSGIKTTDELVHVDHFSTKASIASVVDDTANCSITSAGNIQSGTDTSSDLLRVFWNDLSPLVGSVQATSLGNYQFSIIDGTGASSNIAVANSQTDDRIIHVSHYTTKSAIESVVDDTSNCSFTSDGQFQSSTNTTADQLLVIWQSNSGAVKLSKSINNIGFAILSGSTAVNNIAVSGIVTTDSILHCGHYATATVIATMADITSEVDITSDGNIQLTTTNTSSNTLWLVWSDNSA